MDTQNGKQSAMGRGKELGEKLGSKTGPGFIVCFPTPGLFITEKAMEDSVLSHIY
jgi:hypothetical protein